MLSLVQKAAKARGDAPVDNQFIQKALELINEGLVDVEKYPTGQPSLKGVYLIAVELESGANR